MKASEKFVAFRNFPTRRFVMHLKTWLVAPAFYFVSEFFWRKSATLTVLYLYVVLLTIPFKRIETE